MILRNLTHFDALLGFGLPIPVGRSRNSVAVKCSGSWRAIASYSLNSVSSKLKRVHVVHQGAHELSASPLYLWPRNSLSSFTEADKLLVHRSYFDSMFLEPQARKKGVLVSGLNASFFSMQYFH